jgi:hypothetical protein
MDNSGATSGLVSMGWMSAALLLVVAVMCWAAGRGLVRMNGFVGIRLPALQRDEAAWRAGHRAGVLPAGVTAAVAVIGALVGLAVTPAYWVAVGALLVGLVWTVAAAVRAARAA